MMGVPLTGTFDSDTETLTITHKEQQEDGEAQQPAAGSAEGRRLGFQQQQQQQGWQQGSSSAGDSQQQQQQQEPVPISAQLGLNNEHFNLRVWLDHMQGKVINRQHIPKVELPLEVGLQRGRLDLRFGKRLLLLPV
jgi:hypothetical protein